MSKRKETLYSLKAMLISIHKRYSRFQRNGKDCEARSRSRPSANSEGPFIFPSCASLPAGRCFFHGRQPSSSVSSAHLLRYHPVVDEVVNGPGSSVMHVHRVDAASKSLRTHAGEGATIREPADGSARKVRGEGNESTMGRRGAGGGGGGWRSGTMHGC